MLPSLDVEEVSFATRGQYLTIAIDSTVEWTVNRSDGLYFVDEFGVCTADAQRPSNERLGKEASEQQG